MIDNMIMFNFIKQNSEFGDIRSKIIDYYLKKNNLNYDFNLMKLDETHADIKNYMNKLSSLYKKLSADLHIKTETEAELLKETQSPDIYKDYLIKNKFEDLVILNNYIYKN